MQNGFPLIVGLFVLGLIFWLGFIIWWQLMSVLFKDGQYFYAVLVAYLLPSIYTLFAYLSSKLKTPYLKLLHFYSFFFLSLIFFLFFKIIGGKIIFDSGAYLGMAFIAAVMALMQYPKAGLKNYQVYKTSLFIGGVIFMPLFIYFAAMLPNVPSPPTLDKAILFPLGMLGFWLSGAWLVSRYTQGKYVPGLEIKPLMPFRPDFILPGGVTFVKGLIMMGVGLMIMIHPALGMPKWNWWGFVLAFWGIITLIPLRGMYKMVKGRRLRLLGLGGTGFKAEFYKDLILFVGLNILLYGFVNAFFGTTPFLKLGALPEFNAFLANKPTFYFGILMLILSFIILVFIRGFYKLKLLEGIETIGQRFIKQLLLWLGSLFLLIAYIHLLYLPPIRSLGFLWFYPDANPVGFWVGLLLFLAGSALILVFRPIALKNEFEETIRTMTCSIADLPEKIKRWVMKNRIDKLTTCQESQRDKHVLLMMEGLNYLPEEKKKNLIQTQLNVLSTECSSEQRRMMMGSIDKAMFKTS